MTTGAPETSSREAPLRDPRLAALPSDRLLDDLRIPVGRGFGGTIAATGAPAVLHDASGWGSAVDANAKTAWFELRA